MHVSRIVCLLHIFSPWRSKADGLLDFVREPIHQGCGIDIGMAPGRATGNLRPGFDIAQLRRLAQAECSSAPSDLWLATYHRMPDAALEYLFDHLPGDALVLGSEMPPWLRRACDERQRALLDIRQSPLSFGRDSFIALDTNDSALRSRLSGCAISEEEMRLEASLLSANLRIHRAQLEEAMRHAFNLDDTLIYVWQAPWDTSLLQADGRALHISDFATPLRDLVQGRRLMFMRDFTDTHTADLLEQERAALSTLLGQPIQFCPQNIYQVLAGHDNSALVSINAAAHQEAPYFRKPSHAFAPPVTPLASKAEAHGYLQVHFQDILAPAFWHQLLTPQAAAPSLPRLPALDRQHARESMNDWGEYEKVLTWERQLPWQAYRRLGGMVAEKRIEALEKRVLTFGKSGSAVSADTADEMAARIRELKDTKVGETAYILGNGPSINDLDIEKLMKLESFWCNHAYRMEEKGIRFRPKYYFLFDAIGIQRNPEQILNIDAGIKFLGPEASKLFKIMKPEACENIITFHLIRELEMHKAEDNFSTDPSAYVFDGRSIVTVAIQFAFYMGYSRILLGGVDLDYSQPYFYNSHHQHKNDSISLAFERLRKYFDVLKKNFQKHGRTLGKITDSPNLPLEYIDIPDLKLKPPSTSA